MELEQEWVDVSVAKDGGILKRILEEGNGEERPGSGSEVEVHYVGTLEDGSKFDSSRDRSETFKFALGKGSVIKGWDQGVATMRKGEKAVLKIREDYGYGKSGSGSRIPGGATLLFEIELFGWEEKLDKVTDDGGIRKKVLVAAADRSWEKPSEDEKVTYRYVLYASGKEVARKDAESFVVGDETQPPFLEQAVTKMAKGETARVFIKASHGFGAAGNAELGVAPDTDLEAEVAVLEYERLKSSWDLSDDEKLETAAAIRAEAAELFKAGKYARALRKYARALRYLDYDSSFSDELKAKSADLKATVHLNEAVCFLKLGDAQNVVDRANKVLSSRADSVKALYLRGKARGVLRQYEEAVADLEAASALDSKDKAVATELASLRSKLNQQLKKDRELYSKMFK